MVTLEGLIYYPELLVNDRSYPIVYIDDPTQKRLKPEIANNRIEFYNVRTQWDIDRQYLLAFLNLHVGEEL